MAFEQCGTPAPEDLLMRNQGASIGAYADDLREHLEFWTGFIRRPEVQGDEGRLAIGADLYKALSLAVATCVDAVPMDPFEFDTDEIELWDPSTWVGLPPNPYVVELHKRRAVGALGMSFVLRSLMDPKENVAATLAAYEESIILLDDASEPIGLPGGFMIHMSPQAAEVILPGASGQDGWHKQGNLRIRRTVGAQRMSSSIVAALLQADAPAGFTTGLVTLEAHLTTNRS